MNENCKNGACNIGAGENGTVNPGIHCDVRECAFHKAGGHCLAAQVSIGPSGATTCAQTLCATFRERGNETT